MLAELYNELENAYEEKNIDKSINTCLEESEVNEIINNFYTLGTGTSKSLDAESSTDSTLYDEEIPQELEPYIYHIEEIKYQKGVSLMDIVTDIEIYETEVLRTSNISSDNLTMFLSYTSTTRASLAYWTSNLDSWDKIIGDTEYVMDKGLWSSIVSFVEDTIDTVSDWITTNYEKIYWSAASDAAGAVVGAALGAQMGGEEGAVIGAAIVGAASSAEAWSTGEFSIVIPFSKLINAINNAD